MNRSEKTSLLSASGRASGRWLTAMPVSAQTQMSSQCFQISLRRRLGLDLPLGPRTCPGKSCRKQLDHKGHHLASCPRTGFLKRRSIPLEKARAQVFRESGARVVENQLLRDTGVGGVSPDDQRQLEVVAYNLPLFHGVPLCCDATLVSALRSDGVPTPRADRVAGAALARADKRKRQTYHELVNSRQAKLLVLGCEVGGRWSHDVHTILPLLATAKARSAPARLRKAACQAYLSRWWAVLSVAAQTADSATLCGDATALRFASDVGPPLGDIVGGPPAAPAASRVF